MEFFAGGAEGGFLPKKEPSAIFSKEIGHFFWQLLYASRSSQSAFLP
jgi:hypothetical protein